MDGARSGPSDEDLVRRARAGDESAARELFDRHRGALRARVRRKLPRRLRAKVAESDVVQEAYLAAFLRLGDFEDRGDGSFARWIATIVERKVLDEVRDFAGTSKRDVRREEDVRSGIVRIEHVADDRSVGAGLREAEEREQIARAMASLPPSQREVMRLVHDERLTVADAAVRMGRTLAAARKLYSRAVLRLSDELRETTAG